MPTVQLFTLTGAGQPPRLAFQTWPYASPIPTVAAPYDPLYLAWTLPLPDHLADLIAQLRAAGLEVALGLPKRRLVGFAVVVVEATPTGAVTIRAASPGEAGLTVPVHHPRLPRLTHPTTGEAITLPTWRVPEAAIDPTGVMVYGKIERRVENGREVFSLPNQ